MTAGANSASELTGSFRAHANYLDAFAYLMGFKPFVPGISSLESLAGNIDTAIKGKKPATPAPDVETVLSCLNRGWGTELLLNVSRRVAGEHELVKLSNSWGVVQLYYASYAATQALIVSEGMNRPETHPATQSKVEHLWVNRSFAIAPFSFSLTSPTNARADANGILNGPGRPIDLSVHVWSNCSVSSCWDIAASALRSTRRNELERKLRTVRKDKGKAKKRDWQAEEDIRLAAGKKPRKRPPFNASPNLNALEKATADQNFRGMTFVDYLYRLRIKANYEEARMFTEGPEQEHESENVSQNLARLAAGTLLAHELRVGQLIGKNVLMRAVDDWVTTNSPPGDPRGLEMRRDLLEAHLH